MGAKVGTVAFFTAMARAVPLADEDQVRLHLEAYNKYLNITKQKKELLTEYKKAKEEERISRMTRASKATQATKQLNADLDFGLGNRR